MGHFFLAGFLSVVSTASGAAGKGADEAKRQFEALYGREHRRVSATPDPADDAALARQLVDVAKQGGADVGFLAVLCERAYQLGGSTPAGYDAAIEAMESLAEKAPNRRRECQGKVLAVLRRRYGESRGDGRTVAGEALIRYLQSLADEATASGDYASATDHVGSALGVGARIRSDAVPRLRAEQKRLAALKRTAAEMKGLERRLRANAGDQAARIRLVQLLVVSMDAPQRAIEWLGPDVGEPWKTCVPLAAEDPKSLAPAACRELGDWYRGLAEEAAPPGRRAMLLRAEAHYEIFLSKAPPDHAARGAVGPALAKVRQDLGLRSAPAQAPAGQSAGRLTGALSLVADPAKIQGVRSWTLETRRPRGRILALAYSPDAKHIAVAGECGTVRLLSAESGKLVRAFAGHENEVRDLAFLPNGTTLASASADKTIRFWDVGTGCCVRALSVRAGINAVAISPDGKTVATATDEKAVAIWNIETGRAGGLLQGGHQAGIEAMAWSPDGKWVASGGGQGDGTACVWDAITKRRLHAIQPGFNAIGALAWSPDGQVLAIGDGQKKGKGAALWDVRSRKIVRSLGGGFARKTVALAWSPDGKKLAMRGQECVQAWRAHTGQAAEKFQVGWELSGLAWSPDGSKLAACDPDRRIALWQAGDGKRLWSIRVQHTGGARAIAWRPGQKRVAVWPDPGNLSIWDMTTAERTSEAVVGEGRALRWSPNGKLLAYDQIKQIVLLDGESGKRLRSFGYTECESGIQAFQWSPDSRRLALTAHYGADPMVFDVSSGRMLRQLKGYASGACIDLDWSPNGKMVALGALGEAGLAKNVAIWQADTGRHLGVLVAPGPKEARPTCIAWAPDNMRIVAGATDGVVLVWDLRKGRKVRRLADGEDRISAVSWSPSGAIVAAAEEPRRGGSPIRLWDGRTAREKGVLRGHVAGVRWLAWSRDSRTLLSACNRVVRFWDIQAMRPRLTFLRLQGLRAVVIGAGGHFRATASLDVEASLVYVVQTDKGQDTLSPSAFAERHGWKNDPTKVRP